jgi:hypothetical protein
MNGNDAVMSAEAAGIAVCLLTYSHHACRTMCSAMTGHYAGCGITPTARRTRAILTI